MTQVSWDGELASGELTVVEKEINRRDHTCPFVAAEAVRMTREYLPTKLGWFSTSERDRPPARLAVDLGSP